MLLQKKYVPKILSPILMGMLTQVKREIATLKLAINQMSHVPNIGTWNADQLKKEKCAKAQKPEHEKIAEDKTNRQIC